ncbi:hypothetical protein HNQ07_004806 [Deinococcus metalli]|uniref:Uncharacterized protein n=1 Tax=Deinococcus metalli TaxID=1141878 RepID=A0A7W8KLN5_9DEIO|nr:hypothetical protein [Deinococcus metalli]MBB5379291.1 hypothetical protein [Deinococcus metalli]
MTQWYVRHGPYGDREALTADTRDDAARQWSLACGFRQPPVHEGRGTYRHEGTHTGPGEPAPTFRVYPPRSTEGRGKDELTWVVTLANRHPWGPGPCGN